METRPSQTGRTETPAEIQCEIHKIIGILAKSEVNTIYRTLRYNEKKEMFILCSINIHHKTHDYLEQEIKINDYWMVGLASSFRTIVTLLKLDYEKLKDFNLI